MMDLIIGGSGSGKSAYAEEVAIRCANHGQLYYLATMDACGTEGKKRVQRHRALRQNKGFETLEQQKQIENLAEQIEEGATILLECVSNLVANEMFSKDCMLDSNTVENAVMKGICILQSKTENLIIVTNTVFEDGILYGETTNAYLSVLGHVNQRIAKMAERVIEVTAGIPVVLKKGE